MGNVLAWLAALLVGAYRSAQHGGHNRNEGKLVLWLGAIKLISFFPRTNVKKKSGDQEVTGTEVFRKIAKESG